MQYVNSLRPFPLLHDRDFHEYLDKYTYVLDILKDGTRWKDAEEEMNGRVKLLQHLKSVIVKGNDIQQHFIQWVFLKACVAAFDQLLGEQVSVGKLGGDGEEDGNHHSRQDVVGVDTLQVQAFHKVAEEVVQSLLFHVRFRFTHDVAWRQLTTIFARYFGKRCKGQTAPFLLFDTEEPISIPAATRRIRSVCLTLQYASNVDLLSSAEVVAAVADDVKDLLGYVLHLPQITGCNTISDFNHYESDVCHTIREWVCKFRADNAHYLDSALERGLPDFLNTFLRRASRLVDVSNILFVCSTLDVLLASSHERHVRSILEFNNSYFISALIALCLDRHGASDIRSVCYNGLVGVIRHNNATINDRLIDLGVVDVIAAMMVKFEEERPPFVPPPSRDLCTMLDAEAYQADDNGRGGANMLSEWLKEHAAASDVVMDILNKWEQNTA